jgi:hypothetical protein
MNHASDAYESDDGDHEDIELAHVDSEPHDNPSGNANTNASSFQS